MKERIKKFVLRIWDEIVSHLAKYIAAIIIAAISVLCVISWKWLKTKHALEMYGFIRVIAVVGIILLSILLFWLIIRKTKKNLLINETDIKIDLNDYWKNKKPVIRERRAYSTAKSEFTIRCSSVDNERGLKKGSAAKFLPEIIEREGVYAIVKMGKDRIHVQRKNEITKGS